MHSHYKQTNYPLVSIVMAAYNNAIFLPEAIEGILNQTYSNFELFIIDDGSTDNSSIIIQKYTRKDKRVIYLKNGKNLGQSATRNKAITKARGKYIAIADSDDICLPERLERQVDYLESHPELGVLGCGFYTFTDNPGDYKLGYHSPIQFRGGKVPVHNPTCMIRKILFDKYGLFNSKFDNAEDVELYLRFYCQGTKFETLPKRLYMYRISHGNNVSEVRLRGQVYMALKINLLALTKYRIRYSLQGYLYTLEIALYYVYLLLGLDKLYRRSNISKRNTQILQNVRAHDKVAQQYEKEHGEIYNDIEQKRLRVALQSAVKEIRTDASPIRCLDYGCGTGNMTRHLLKMRLNIVSADISPGFLALVMSRYRDQLGKNLDTLLLNGEDLSNIATDNSYDFICTYSVLHHIPDYLGVIKEFARVLKPGGVLYIDHEAAPDNWENNADYKEYSQKINNFLLENTKSERLLHLLTPRYWLFFIKSLLNPRFRVEGDIHVFPDDHIEWDEVIRILNKNKVKIAYINDYLLYTKHYPVKVYNRYKSICTNTRLIVARKENGNTVRNSG